MINATINNYDLRKIKKDIFECFVVCKIGKIIDITEDGFCKVELIYKQKIYNNSKDNLILNCIISYDENDLKNYTKNDYVIILFTDEIYNNWKKSIGEIQSRDSRIDNFSTTHNLNNGIIISKISKNFLNNYVGKKHNNTEVSINTQTHKIIFQNPAQDLLALQQGVCTLLKDLVDTIKLLQTAIGGFINSSILDVIKTQADELSEKYNQLLEKKS